MNLIKAPPEREGDKTIAIITKFLHYPFPSPPPICCLACRLPRVDTVAISTRPPTSLSFLHPATQWFSSPHRRISVDLYPGRVVGISILPPRVPQTPNNQQLHWILQEKEKESVHHPARTTNKIPSSPFTNRLSNSDLPSSPLSSATRQTDISWTRYQFITTSTFWRLLLVWQGSVEHLLFTKQAPQY